MPMKRDAAGHRSVEMEILLPGTPEQVWEAIATGPGNAAWFVRGEIEPRVGGALRLDFGAGVSTTGEVTAWEPPRRFGYVEREWAPGAPPVATEITIAARSGDSCVMRMVHSLFSTTDDWDDQLEGFEAGWPGFFAVLRLYLKHFPRHGAGSFMAIVPSAHDGLASWVELCARLGLTGANVGERRDASGIAGAPSLPEAWSGVVERVYQDAEQRYLVLRIEGAAPGLALVGTFDKGAHKNVNVCRYVYATDGAAAAARAAEVEPAWRAWLAETMGAPKVS